MKKVLSLCCMVALVGGNVYAQKKKTTPAKETKTSNGFKAIGGGLEYKTVNDVASNPNPQVGDFVEVHIHTTVNDSVIFDTRAVNNNMPVQFQVNQPQFAGDIVNGLKMMTPGDSAVLMLSVDSIVKAGTPVQAWMKTGTNQKIVYGVVLVSVKTAAEMQKEQMEKSAAQRGIDEKMIQDFLAKNNIKANKTESGLYYKTDKAGTGPNAKKGETVTVNYTGRILDGEVFDSNIDPKFQHVEPFSFDLGMGRVIKGWDEGIALFNKGAKGTLYIPSTLAYGAQGQGPIKPNSILVFEIELTDIKASEGSKN